LDAGKIRQESTCNWRASGIIQGSLAAFKTIIKVLGGYLKAGTTSLKEGFSKDFLELVSVFEIR
jgi:hypothetical protein